MNAYKKIYIGKGTQVPNLSIAKCTVKVSEMLKFVHEFNGEEYVTFEVAKMQEQDKFGRDYTVYCVVKETVEEPSPKKQRKSKKEKVYKEIPF